VHYDGQGWQSMAAGTSAWLWGVWGSGPTDVYAVGLGGSFLHYDGISWLKLNAETTAKFYGIHGTGSTFYVVGESGTIYRHTQTGSLP
jgi:hypothetical protein